MKNQNQGYQIDLKKLNGPKKLRYENQGLTISLTNSPKSPQQSSVSLIYTSDLAIRSPKLYSPYLKSSKKLKKLKLPSIAIKSNLQLLNGKEESNQNIKRNIFQTQNDINQKQLSNISTSQNGVNQSTLCISPNMGKLKVLQGIYKEKNETEKKTKTIEQGLIMQLKVPSLKCNKCMKHKDLFAYLEVKNKKNWN